MCAIPKGYKQCGLYYEPTVGNLLGYLMVGDRYGQGNDGNGLARFRHFLGHIGPVARGGDFPCFQLQIGLLVSVYE